MLRAQKAVQTLARAGVGARRAAGPRPRARPEGDDVVLEDGDAARGRRVVWACGGWLRAPLPRASSTLTRHPPGAVLLRRRPAVARRARLGRLRPRDLRHRRPRRARRQGGARLRGPAARPRRDAARQRPGDDERWIRDYFAGRFPALADAPLKGVDDLPLRAVARLALHRRASTPSTRACGSSAAAPATASSTARRWPSGWPRALRGEDAAARALRARRALRGALDAHGGLESSAATNTGV